MDTQTKPPNNLGNPENKAKIPSRISAKRHRYRRYRKTVSLTAVVALLTMFSAAIIVTGESPSQAADLGAVWINYGNSKMQLNARKSTDGTKVAVCATDRQINSPRGKWVSYQGRRAVSAGSEYRSNAATFEISAKKKGATTVFAAEKQYQVAYLAGQLRGAIEKGEKELGATVYAIHSLSGRLMPQQTQSAEIKSRANELLSQAKSYAGPYKLGRPEIKLLAGSTQGTLKLPIVQSSAGNAISNLNETVSLSGPARFKGTKNANTISVLSANALKELPIEVTGPGKVDAQINVRGLPPTTFEIWEHQRWQDLLIAGPLSALSANTSITAEPRQFFRVKTQTQAEIHKQNQGNQLIDKITVKAEGQWGKNTGKQTWQTVKIDLSLYGPFSEAQGPGQIPADAKPVKTWQIPATPASLEEAENGVAISNEKDPYLVEKPGFYTFVAAAHRALQPADTYLKDDYVPAFFEESETQIVPFTPTVKTQAKVVIDKESKILTDQVELKGFPDNHPEFTGKGKWKADEKTVRNDLYCLPQPIKNMDANKRKPLAQIELPAKNGTYTVDKDKKGKPLSLNEFPCKDTYVFVTSYAGDSRTQAMRSSETETSEQYQVSPPTTPPTTPPATTPPPPTTPPEPPTVLSATGAKVSGMLGLALVALGSGGLLVFYRARRR